MLFIFLTLFNIYTFYYNILFISLTLYNNDSTARAANFSKCALRSCQCLHQQPPGWKQKHNNTCFLFSEFLEGEVFTVRLILCFAKTCGAAFSKYCPTWGRLPRLLRLRFPERKSEAFSKIVYFQCKWCLGFLLLSQILAKKQKKKKTKTSLDPSSNAD